MLQFVLIFSAIGVALFVLTAGCCLDSVRRRALKAEAQLKTILQERVAVEHEQKEQLSIQVIDQKAELTYLRDFHIREGDLTFEMKLAEGGEGEVWRGALSGKLEKVVIKKAKNAGDAHVWDEAEVAFMMRMKHPRLVTFHGAGVLASGPYPFSVLEFLSGGSIDCRLWNPEPTPRDSVTWQERIRWGSDTAEAMAFIHSHGFCHRDLKSMNVLYDQITGRAKVADFGTARSMHQARQDGDHDKLSNGMALSSSEAAAELAMMTACGIGTTPFLAPEICRNYVAIDNKSMLAKQEIQEIQRTTKDTAAQHDPEAVPRGISTVLASKQRYRKEHDQVEYGMKVDVYAFGITMYEMLVHAQPWHGSNSDDIFRKVNAGERPAMPEFLAGVEVRWCQIMRECWHQDPHRRPDFPAILAQMHELEPQHALMKQGPCLQSPPPTMGNATSVQLVEVKTPSDHKNISSIVLEV